MPRAAAALNLPATAFVTAMQRGFAALDESRHGGSDRTQGALVAEERERAPSHDAVVDGFRRSRSIRLHECDAAGTFECGTWRTFLL